MMIGMIGLIAMIGVVVSVVAEVVPEGSVPKWPSSKGKTFHLRLSPEGTYMIGRR